MVERKYQAILNQAAEKSTKDSTFRKELLQDAHTTIKKEYGEDLPFQVTFHTFDEKNLVFVLPVFEDENEELNLDDLEQVAGGTGGTGTDISGRLEEIIRKMNSDQTNAYKKIDLRR